MHVGTVLGVLLLGALLIFLAWPTFSNQGERVSEIDVQMNALIVATRQYRDEFRKLPPIASLGNALLGDNSKRIPFYTQRLGDTHPVTDPWGHSISVCLYIYGHCLDLVSRKRQDVFDTRRQLQRDGEANHAVQRIERNARSLTADVR